MAARQTKLIASVALLLALLGQAQHAQVREAPKRIVSLVPALTEMLFAIGAGPNVVGVSSFDAFPPDVQKLPRVGALLNPDVERILALRPDLVMTYGSQTELEAQLGRAQIRTFTYRHGGIRTVLDTIRDLGRATGRATDGERVARDLEGRIEAVRTAVKGRRRPRVLLAFERQPGTLQNVFASGGIGFLNEILDAAGGDNVFADVRRESVQPSHETLITRAPDVIIEVSAIGLSENNSSDARKVWSTLASVPAVRNGRIHSLVGEYLVVPGPRLAQATETFARVLHPEAFR